MTLAGSFGTGQVFWSMLWLFLWIIWIWLLFIVFSDMFRSRDLSGWGKAAWTIFVLVLPYLGVFVYLIARGGKMQEHAIQSARTQDAAAREYNSERRQRQQSRHRRRTRPACRASRQRRY